jgi:glutaminyl-tRNA synthetase
VIKDSAGNITELRCTYDPATRGGDSPDGRKVKSTLHLLSAKDAIKADVRLYDHLFTEANPDDVPEGKKFTDFLNPGSLKILDNCFIEPSIANAKPLDRLQFERLGYFCVDPDSKEGQLVFNRTASLRDEWAKIQKSTTATE